MPLQKYRLQLITLAVLAFLFFMAVQGMSAKDWVIIVIRGLSVGAITFLVASGLSLILGLMDVLNLAHGTLFMLGAYAGWTVYVRPDTLVDLLPPLALLAVGFALMPLWQMLLGRLTTLPATGWSWLGLTLAGGLLFVSLPSIPVAIWSTSNYAQSPVSYAIMLGQGQLQVPPAEVTGLLLPLVAVGGLLLAGLVAAISLTGLTQRRQRVQGQITNRSSETNGDSTPSQPPPARGRNKNLPPAGGERGGASGSQTKLFGSSQQPWPWRAIAAAGVLLGGGLFVLALNDALTEWLFGLSTNWRFGLALIGGTLTAALLGGLMEMTLIRPLYARPIYQLMLTLGLAVVGHELVIAIWGRPEFTMPKPALFNGTGDGCPAESLGAWLELNCSTILVLGGRIRVYNEIFVIIVGLVVLVAVTLLLQRSRLGMIIRAGVQDSDMVEALGINVRRVFTLVFALGAGLAGLGGVMAAPSSGLSPLMGESVLLMALIALAIGGLTSFPGAAVGSILVGLMQQFIIKYGQIGIPLPFIEEPFKPSPTLVPASTVLLMVIILLAMPQGLFGRTE